MARDREYELLLNKYNMLVAKCRDMTDQMQTKDRQFRDYEARCDVVDGHARKLCEMILAKDKSEMVLGDSKTWHSFSTDELIAKAQVVFVRYNQERTRLLNEVMAVAERRGQELDSLKDQISQMMHSGNVAATSPEELLEKAERAQKEKEAIDKAPHSTKQALADGRIKVIIEEDGDYDEAETEAIRKMMDVAEQAKLSPTSTPISRSGEKIQKMKEADKETAMAHMVDIQDYIRKCKDPEWAVMDIIGTYGISRYTEIEKQVTEFHPSITTRTTRTATTTLISMGALHKETIATPLTKNASFYKLTHIGARMYLQHFGKHPIESEMEKVLKEHSSAAHGYGIMDLEKILVETNRYTSISSTNRNNPISVNIGGQELQYIPDLVCKNSKFTDYFEYEIGTHTQADFNMKCNKMCKVTKFLNFVTPKQETAQDVKTKIDKWIETRGSGSLRNIVVRIGTAASMQNDGDWLVIYELAKGTQPTKNNLSK